jgi:hypothetical protein
MSPPPGPPEPAPRAPAPDEPSVARVRVLDFARFRERYGPWLEPLDRETRALGAMLRERSRLRRALVVTACYRHNQSPQWWFEQALLAVLVAAGVEVTFVTDSRFTWDARRLARLGPMPRLIEIDEGASVPPTDPCDAVLAMPPSDVATRAALDRDVPLVAFATKNHDVTRPHLTVTPAPGTTFWHAFAAARGWALALPHLLGDTAGAWRLREAPFPVNRYYLPRAEVAPSREALIFGTNRRDVPLALDALVQAGVQRIAVLGDEQDLDTVRAEAAARHLDALTSGPRPHLEMVRLIEDCAFVLNPIGEWFESHYSLSVPLPLGRPVLVTESPGAGPFHDPPRRGVTLVRGGVDEWAAEIARLRDEAEWRRAADDAIVQARERHDAERFFALPLIEVLGRS